MTLPEFEKSFKPATINQIKYEFVDKVYIFGWSSKDGVVRIPRDEEEIAEVVDQLRENFNLDWLYFFATYREVYGDGLRAE